MAVKHKPTGIVHSGIKGGVTGCGVNTNNHPDHWAISKNKITCDKNGCKEYLILKPQETLNKVSKKQKPMCFVIMPFEGWFDSYYSEIYIPAIEDAGFEAKRADDLYRPSNIVSDIWAYTKESSVVLADLTNKNPNVFYELGLAHAITKPAILITSSIEDIPFDLRNLRVLVYDKNLPNWGLDLKLKITKSLKEIQDNPEKSIPHTFLETTKPKKIKISKSEKEILDIKQELGTLRRELLSNSRRKSKSTMARKLIKHLLDLETPHADILDRVHRKYDAPIDWIISIIEELGN